MILLWKYAANVFTIKLMEKAIEIILCIVNYYRYDFLTKHFKTLFDSSDDQSNDTTNTWIWYFLCRLIMLVGLMKLMYIQTSDGYKLSV